MTGCEIRGESPPGSESILTPEALDFIAALTRRFGPRLSELLTARRVRQAEIDAGNLPDFLPGTRELRESDWIITELPEDLQDRRVELLGAAELRTIVDAWNSGANVYIADFEDRLSPTWQNVVNGQVWLRQAVLGTLAYTSEDGTRHTLERKHATLAVRPRGWHLPEKHLLVDGQPAPASLVDFGLYFFHNAHDLTEQGSGPYYSLPKLESHREAHLWTSVFEFAENHLGLRQYSVKATALIETITGAFEIDEIMYVLKDYLVGIECGPTDFLFSFIKTMRAHPEYLVPDRHRIEMTEHLLRAYSQLAIRSAHRRGVLVIGGAASQLPLGRDPQGDAAALAAIREEKAREIADGHDGTWVAHPGLVPVVLDVYAQEMKGRNQLGRLRRDVRVRASDLLEAPVGPTTETGLRANVSVALRYLAAWLAGEGRAAALGRMQDAAGAEAARAQMWQWVHHSALLEDGRRVGMPLVEGMLRDELAAIRGEVGMEAFAAGTWTRACAILQRLTRDPVCADFLTLAAYPELP
jgi:malate synthase